MNESDRNQEQPKSKSSLTEFQRCQAWLCGLSTTETQIMQATSEFQDFVQAFHRLEQAHKLLVKPLIKDEQNIHYKADDDDAFGNRNNCHQLSHDDGPLSHRILQSALATELVWRVFDFCDSQSLVQLSRTCTRFHALSRDNAQHRSSDMALARQLTTPMQLLRAKEQIQGIGLLIHDRHVSVPSLLLSRRVLVSDCGDSEYNGVYFCTGCNGNGFTFTKPREPIERIAQHDWSRLLLSDDLSDHSVASSTSNATSRTDLETEAVTDGVALRCILAKRFSNEVNENTILIMSCCFIFHV
jgi:hypothetical protein